MVERFFAPELSEQEIFLLSEEESRHCLQVKRIRLGESFILFDGKGAHSQAELKSIEKKRALVQRKGILGYDPISPYQFHLALAPPKGEQWKWLLQKVTELGVHTVTPLLCERSVVRPQEKHSQWIQTTIEACKQCGRNTLPQLNNPQSYPDFLKMYTSESHTLFLAHTQGKSLLKEQLSDLKSSLILLIGPEGGFSGKEVESAEKYALRFFYEPSFTLRVETAGIAFLAILRHLLQ